MEKGNGGKKQIHKAFCSCLDLGTGGGRFDLGTGGGRCCGDGKTRRPHSWPGRTLLQAVHVCG